MADKLTRMAARKEDLALKYLQMKKDSKIERSKGSQQLNVMVNASQDAIKVPNIQPIVSINIRITIILSLVMPLFEMSLSVEIPAFEWHVASNDSRWRLLRGLKFDLLILRLQ